MLDIDAIYGLWYEEGSALRVLLRTHSELVAQKALECADRHCLDVDREFLEEAALLHDIGIVKTDAPGILCYGTEPYIRHGVIGREMLDGLGLHRHALVCERHTGSGLTVRDIQEQHLPLPLRDMTPRSLEEELICYADKFYSKSGDFYREKPLARVLKSLEKHGPETVARFKAMHEKFG